MAAASSSSIGLDVVAPPGLKAVTLTHVRYHPGDTIGHCLAWVSLVPVFISLGGFVSHLLFRRDLHTILFAAGLLLSQLLNGFIKTSVQQARPETCALLETCDSHGWPSSHSQYMFFFAAFFSLHALLPRRHRRPLLAFLPWPLAVLTLISRVYLGYHSVSQVFAGAVLGLVLGAGWFYVVNVYLVKIFPAIEESAIGRYFYLKDCSHLPNVLKFEYDNARAARTRLAARKVAED